jgi:hypothetical protein
MVDQTEVEVKDKKPGLLRRILWWVWVALLVILLVFGLIFAASWRVLVLFAIFLAAATILPRRHRKWFWAGVCIVITALVVWVLMPEDDENWRPYTFDKELAQLQAKYAVPDSENAAIIYNQILENWKRKEPNEPNLPDDWRQLAMKGPWLSKDRPEIAAYLWYYRDTIDRLVQVSQFERCAFPIISNIVVLGEQLDRLSSMRKWAYLLAAAGNNAVAEGNLNEALEKYLTVLRMGHHLSQQPSAMYVLVGMAAENFGLRGIKMLIVREDVNESYLSKAEQAVSKIAHDWSYDLPGFIDTDKLVFKNMCGGMWYQVNTRGRIRISRDSWPAVEQIRKRMNKAEGDSEIYVGFWWKKLLKTYTILYWFCLPSSPDKLGEIIDESYEKRYRMARADFDWSKKPHNEPPATRFKLNLRYLTERMAQLTVDAYFGLHGSYLRSSLAQKGTLLIIALKRYKNANGQWPERLEDARNFAPAEIFIDPLNGGSFVYRLIEENFTLYSKGENGVDEDGQLQSKLPQLGQPPETPSPDDRMIWPLKSSECK